jgi:hypothetical protein
VADAGGEAIYTSSDMGVTWAVRNVSPLQLSLTSSNDGSRLLAGANGGTLYFSSDAGVTWNSRSTSDAWTGVASSADGSKLVAVSGSGTLETSAPTPVATTTIGATGGLQGAQYSAIDLQYAGNDVFLVRDSSGLIDVQ